MKDAVDILEKDLPARHWIIMYHLMTHMASQIERWGPVRNLWMYGFEDFFGYIMRLIKTRSNPVESIMRADRATQVLSMGKELLVQERYKRRQRGMENTFELSSKSLFRKYVKRTISRCCAHV